MSKWASELSSFLSRNDMRAAEAAELSGLPQPIWSRWLNGVQVFVGVKYLQSVFANVVKKPEDQALLLAARIEDENLWPGRKVEVKVLLDGKVGKSAVSKCDLSGLPPRTQRAIENLIERAPNEKGLREMLHTLAEFSQRDPKTGHYPPAE